MIISCLPYIIIQIPALIEINNDDNDIASAEKSYAITGSILEFGLMGYLYYQYDISRNYFESISLFRQRKVAAMLANDITLLGLMTTNPTVFTIAVKMTFN